MTGWLLGTEKTVLKSTTFLQVSEGLGVWMGLHPWREGTCYLISFLKCLFSCALPFSRSPGDSVSSAKCSSVGAGLAESQRVGDWFRRRLPVWLGGQGTFPSFPVAGIPTPETCVWTGHLPGTLGFRLGYD